MKDDASFNAKMFIKSFLHYCKDLIMDKIEINMIHFNCLNTSLLNSMSVPECDIHIHSHSRKELALLITVA